MHRQTDRRHSNMVDGATDREAKLSFKRFISNGLEEILCTIFRLGC